MKMKDDYVLKEFEGNYILIPANHKVNNDRSMLQLNETGAFICKNLEKEISFPDLLAAVTDEYGTDTDDIRSITCDLEEFLNQMRFMKLLSE